MAIREEFEILRGEPIAVNDIAPADVPCIETSDAEKLCRHPVVSVHMMAYNHAKYIARAIEGVVMQETDFEYELVIGEDCSKDDTRKICFEYQKRHPEKIRVLWHHENVHNRGGNGARIHAHCRGEFVAFCEGDDYWTDPKKLQKQVDVMRRNPSVGLCFTGAMIYREKHDSWQHWNDDDVWKPGLIPSEQFRQWHLFGKDPAKGPIGSETFIMTATTLVRRSVLMEAKGKYEIFKWKLRLGDTTNWLGVTASADAYYLPDETAVYAQYDSGAMGHDWSRVAWDARLVRLYFFSQIYGRDYCDAPKRFLLVLVQVAFSRVFKDWPHFRIVRYVCDVFRCRRLRGIFFNRYTILPTLVTAVCFIRPLRYRLAARATNLILKVK